MARPVDWSPLAESDPVPGAPGEVAELARRYRDTARAISTAASKLRSIAATDGWIGDAALEFRDQARDVADSIERAHGRYDETGQALDGFHPDHEQAQRQSASALDQAQSAETAKRIADSRYQTEEAKAEPDESLLRTYERQARDAQTDLESAEGMLESAVTTFDDAADRAAARIHEVSQNDGLKTNWRDRLASILTVVANIAGMIAAVAGILALLVGWIPIIGQALAAVLGAIALIAGVISLVANLALLIMGEGSWKAVLLDAIGVLTFGVGRLFTGAAKFSAKAAKLGAWKKAMPRSGAGWGRMRNWLGGRLPAVGTRNPPRFDSGLVGDAFGGAYRGVFRDIGQLKFVWRNRHAFPTTGTSLPHQAVSQFSSRWVGEMRNAYNAGGVHGVTHTFFGNADLAADLAKVRALAPSSGSPQAFANTALIQSSIAGAGQLTGAVTTLLATPQLAG